MAHGLRYYKELTHDDGKVVRLEILEKDYTGASMEIGPVCQALRLDIQGDTEIDAPIVKTSLTMTFVDAPDHADAKTKKCGNWQEFYTSDATKWQVVIKVRKEAGLNFVTMWGGYITPDSYNEVLTYRGSVTLVARDNIGHMNDFPFDAEGDANGMISMRDVIGSAWAKIESPMSLRLYYDDWMLTNDVVAYDTMMNVSAFEGKSWGEAVEMVLFAYGATLRYVGYNDVAIRPLRWIPQMGAAQGEAVKAIEPTFISGAERELVPAVRRVEENVDYDVEGTVSDKVDVSDFVGSTEDVWILGNESNSGGIVYPIVNKTRGRGWCNPADSLFFNPYPYSFLDGKEEDRGFTWLTCNTAESSFSRYAEYSLYAKPDNINLYCKFGPSYSLGAPERLAPADSLLSCLIAVAVEQNGITSYLTNEGEWVSEPTRLEKDLSESPEFNLPIPLVKYSGAVLLRVLVLQVKTTATYRDAVSYVPLYSLALGCDKPMLEKNGVNTNYNDENNVILSREPKIAPALNDVAFTRFIKNGIFTADGDTFLPAKRWAWPGTTPQQMAVYNHLQLLCYHSKPNNVLRGTIVNADLSDLRVIWMWHGAEHMLVSGSINYLNGHLENAVLREFARYEDMWGMLEPADLPEVEGNSSTNVEGGASSGSNGASITNRTEVYIGSGGGSITLDSYMSDTSENGVMNRVIKAYVDDVRNDLTDLWRLDEDGNIVADKQVIIKNNLIVSGDTGSGGEGEDNPGGGGGDLDLDTLEAYLSDNKYINADNLDTYGVATKSWVTEQGFAKASALSSYQPLSTAINTGNIGSQSVSHATTTNRFKYIASSGDLNTVLAGGGLARTYSNYMSNIFTNAPSGMRYGMVLQLSAASAGAEALSGQLAWDVNHASTTDTTRYLWWRASDSTNGFTYGKWHQIAFTDSNVASAQALIHSNGTVGAVVNSSGNVTIGSSDLAETSYMLYINGKTGANGNITSVAADNSVRKVIVKNSVASSSLYVATSGNRGIYDDTNAKWIIYSNGTTTYMPYNDVSVGGSLIVGGSELRSSTPSGGSYPIWRIAHNTSNVFLQAGKVDGTSTAGNLYITGINSSDLGLFAVYAPNSYFKGNVCPQTGNTYNLGTSSYMWSTTYTRYIDTASGYVLRFKVAGTEYMNLSTAGNLCIGNGSSTGSERLHVYGNAIVSGDVASGSDIRFKDIIKNKTIKIEHIAKAPLFTFRWNDREDDTIHLGSSAQYWEKVCPWLVSGEDFKHLNYAGLGVAMGISLAKKVVNHEERIKVLEKEIKRLKGEQYGS